MRSCKKQINLGYRDVSMIWLGTHVIGAVVSGHAAALNGNKFRGCQPETVRKWVAEMSTNALSHNLGFGRSSDMKRIKFYLGTGYAGCSHEEIFEFDDDATEEEINDSFIVVMVHQCLTLKKCARYGTW